MKHLYLLLIAMLITSTACASPGAHGPNGEHLDGQATATGAVTSTPRIETFTESFELLGHLAGGELSIMIDRYETNEPVLNGALEVQYKQLKAKATFHADQGDYAVDDPAFLAAIATPGAHPLLFTLVAGEESDLLEGVLTAPEPATEHDHEHGAGRRWWLVAAAALALVAVAAVFLARRRRQRKGA